LTVLVGKIAKSQNARSSSITLSCCSRVISANMGSDPALAAIRIRKLLGASFKPAIHHAGVRVGFGHGTVRQRHAASKADACF
jgi:hypothetical protein